MIVAPAAVSNYGAYFLFLIGFRSPSMPTAADIILNSIALAETGPTIGADRQTKAEFKKGNGPLVAGVDSRCSYQSLPTRMQHETFFRDCVETVLEEAIFFGGADRKSKVVNWKSPQELQQAMDFTVKRAPTTHEKLLQHIKNVIKYSVKTAHPYFMNQLFSRLVAGAGA